MPKGSDLLVAALENEGVERIFGVPGEENLDVVESLRQSSIKLVITRHEQAAAFMATTYGRLRERMAAVLGRLVAEIAKLSSRIEHAVADLPDGRIVMSFPRAGRICAAQILAEPGNVRERFPTEDQLAAEAGIAPVTHASRKSRGVVFRWACNENLHLAITRFADNSRHASAWAANTYSRARQRGCRHPHAVRTLARAWGRVPWRAWQTGTAYDPENTSAQPRLPPPNSEVDTGCLIRPPFPTTCH